MCGVDPSLARKRRGKQTDDLNEPRSIHDKLYRLKKQMKEKGVLLSEYTRGRGDASFSN